MKGYGLSTVVCYRVVLKSSIIYVKYCDGTRVKSPPSPQPNYRGLRAILFLLFSYCFIVLQRKEREKWLYLDIAWPYLAGSVRKIRLELRQTMLQNTCFYTTTTEPTSPLCTIPVAFIGTKIDYRTMIGCWLVDPLDKRLVAHIPGFELIYLNVNS